MQWSAEDRARFVSEWHAAQLKEFGTVNSRAFLRGAHAMNGAAELERQAAKADAIALLTLLQDTTQSRSVAERCAKAKAVLG